jgi:hypothetical protein
MLSESARMSSAAEARFRVQAPNSLPRTVTVIALDPEAERAVRRLSESGGTHAKFLTAPVEADVADLSGQPHSLKDEVDASDLVVLVASPGGDAQAASVVGEACSRRRVMTTAFIVGATPASDEALSKTLAQVRPWSLMVVIANSDDYLADMMTALRA